MGTDCNKMAKGAHKYKAMPDGMGKRNDSIHFEKDYSKDIYVQNMSSYTLQAAIPLSLFTDNQLAILKNLGNLLEFKLNFISASSLKSSYCVVTFSAQDLKSNATISTNDIGKKVQDKLADITELFNSYLKTGRSSSNTDEGAYNTTSIVLIVIGCVMFVASLLAILVAYLLWKKQRHYAEKEENAARVRERLGEQMPHKVSNASSDPDEHLEMRETKVDVEEQESTFAFETEFKSDISTVALRHSLVDMKTQHMQQLFQSISEEEELGSSQREIKTYEGSTKISSHNSNDRESNIYTNISLSGRNDEVPYKQDESKNVIDEETHSEGEHIQSLDDKLEKVNSEPDYQEISSVVTSLTSPEPTRWPDADRVSNTRMNDDDLSPGRPDVTDVVTQDHLTTADSDLKHPPSISADSDLKHPPSISADSDLKHPPSISDESDSSSDEESTYF
ncbi:hypothetical protein Btru_059181 [Bulinus truncatus]|nr:hypothetical protein Btru_059181 [Bulinus truncatus]